MPAAVRQVTSHVQRAAGAFPLCIHSPRVASKGQMLLRIADSSYDQLCWHRLEAAEGRADKAVAEAVTQAAQLRDLFTRYKAFKSSEVADLAARLRVAMSGGGGGGGSAAGGKENDKAAAALLRCTAHHRPLWGRIRF